MQEQPATGIIIPKYSCYPKASSQAIQQTQTKDVIWPYFDYISNYLYAMFLLLGNGDIAWLVSCSLWHQCIPRPLLYCQIFEFYHLYGLVRDLMYFDFCSSRVSIFCCFYLTLSVTSSLCTLSLSMCVCLWLWPWPCMW